MAQLHAAPVIGIVTGRDHQTAGTSIVVLGEVQHRTQGKTDVDHVAPGGQQSRGSGVLEIQ
jgi:hypothetical protein